MIKINQIYSYVESAINTEYRPVFCSAVRVDAPASFPACYIVEDNHSFIQRNTTINLTDTPLTRNFTVEVFSNKRVKALTEAREIMDDVEIAMKQLGFIETFCGQVDNIDPTIVRIVGRFNRVCGDNDTIE